ncbi:MAG: glycosyltransferase family 39 protein [Anaerolineae bacterium]
MPAGQPSRFILPPLSFQRVLRAHAAALTLQPAAPLSFAENLLLALVHAAGAGALARYFQWPWLVSVELALGLVLVLLVLQRTWRLGAAWLAPWFFVYLVLLSRLVYIRLMHGAIYGYYDYNPPEWGLLLLYVEGIAVAALLYSAAILTRDLLDARWRVAVFAAVLLLSLSIAWAGYKYFGQRTSGATGSDPYAYVQMAVDLAERNTPVHRFALFPEIGELQLPWYPLVHVGYHLPMNMQGDAVTVWPPGGAIAYVAAFKLAGEEGLYWVNPAFSLLCGLVAGWLAWALLAQETVGRRWLIVAMSVAYILTASVQVVWAGVTMVDTQAECLSVLVLVFALYACRRQSWLWPLLAGAALGAAYDIRHTQLVLGPSLVLLYGFSPRPRAARLQTLLLSAAAALFVALPDLWYHQAYLGGWLHPESEELALFSLKAIGDTANSLYQTAFAANEFGWLLPLLIYGMVQFARRMRIEFAALALWLGLSLALHLPYTALRLRDLLPELPIVALFVSYGLVDLCHKIVRARRLAGQLVGGMVLITLIELCLLRVWNTVPSAWQPPQPIFGYMTQGQRAAFHQLAALTPPGAMIGATLNSGAIELYAQRDSFRPDGWTNAEREQFLQVMFKPPAVYLLEDSRALDPVLDELRQHYLVHQVTILDVPLFGDGPPAAPGALWKIEPDR